MAYTDATAIQLRLKGWASTNPSSAFAETEVSTDLINHLITQACARIDACLKDRYPVPITGDQPALASCAEKLVMCQLIAQLYAGSTPSNSGDYGALMCSQGEAELEALKDVVLTVEAAAGATTLVGGTTSAGQRGLPSVYKPRSRPQTTIDRIEF